MASEASFSPGIVFEMCDNLCPGAAAVSLCAGHSVFRYRGSSGRAVTEECVKGHGNG